MREGLRWSDGEPVTTEDVRFVYEDIYLNEDITPAFPARYRAAGRPDGEPMTLDIIDDYTFRVSFAEPYGGFLRELTIKGWQGYTELLRPAHHLKQYHTNYTPIEDLQPLMEEQGLTDEWWNLFNQKDCTNWEVTSSTCAGYPSLTPWLLIESQPETMHFVRNPYYFKVDTEGQQLPYIDELISVQVGDVEAVNLRVFTGEVDFLREDTALVKLPLYKENEEKGNYRVHLLDTHVDPTALILNYNYDDPTWQEVISNVVFRRALNMAIKRQEIIESVYFGLASLPETTPGEYDPEAANQLLDEIGMTERDADGFRLGPDGETFVIPIETGGGAPDLVPVTELLIEHFKEIGIKTTLKQIDPTLFGQRAEANELQATVFWSVQPMWGDGTWTDYVPDDRWGPLWRVWYNSNGEEGVEPPDEVKQLYDIYEGRIQAIPSSEEDAALREQLYSLYNENLFFLNIVEKVKYAMIADADLGNIQSAGQAIGADNSGEQFFFKQ
jgi:peptide/nickel transport system substrate-binding protein